MNPSEAIGVRRGMLKLRSGVVALVFWASSPVQGASLTLEITVAADRHERRDVPVCVRVPRERIGDAPIASVSLTTPDGKAIPAQWTKPSLLSTASGGEIHWILPHLAAGELMHLRATLSTDPPPRAPGFTWRDARGHHADLT